MPRRGPAPEKAKDFKGSMKRLIKNLGKWKFTMMLALTLALVSALLALIAPNKLSDFADLIGEGLVPNTKVLEEIGEEINENLGEENQMTLGLCIGAITINDNSLQPSFVISQVF